MDPASAGPNGGVKLSADAVEVTGLHWESWPPEIFLGFFIVGIVGAIGLILARNLTSGDGLRYWRDRYRWDRYRAMVRALEEENRALRQGVPRAKLERLRPPPLEDDFCEDVDLDLES